MRVTTWNLNGVRAAIRKGFDDHLLRIQPDVLLLQEIRAHVDQLPVEWEGLGDWRVVWNSAARKGYSGTAILSRMPVEDVKTGLDAGSDEEGRLIEVTIGGLGIACVYLPSGSSSDERQTVKEAWMKKFRRWIGARQSGGPFLFGGDLNIAHTERDIFYARSNQTTSGFLPHERAWFDRLLKSGWHDVVREHVGDEQGPYSWWSNRGRARELDRGWRIDYLLVNQELRPYVTDVGIDREAGLAVSDHAPVSVDLDWPVA